MAVGKDLELKLRITADGKVAVQQLHAVDQAVDGVGDSAQAAAAPISKLDGAMAGVGKALGALGLGIGAREIIAMAESFGQLQARLKLATDGFGDSGQAMADVQRIADSTGSSLSAVGDLYTKTAGAAKSLGLSQADVATVTETVSQAMKVAGASGAAAEGALTQFSQALASGVLRGEEFNSVYEAAPYLIDQLAKGLGVATEDMRALANEGQLSARSVADALVKQSGAISAAYGQLPDTVGQAMQRVTNALTSYLGGANEATGVTQALAGAMTLLAQNVDLLGPAAAAVAAGGMAKLTQAGVAQVAAIKEQVAGYLAQRAAMAEKAAADTAAAQTAARLAVAELQAARAAQVAALERRAAAAQQLRDMAELSIYGARRAASERVLAAANVELAASERALAAASAQSAAAIKASTAAMAGGAAPVGILSRALGFLAGPGGILLATVAGFAAFAFSQRDAKPPTEDLTDALNRQREAMERLGTDGLKKLIRDESEYQRETQKRLTVLKDQAKALDEQAAVVHRMTAAQKERTGAEQRLQETERQRLDLRAEIEEVERDLARSIDSVRAAQDRQNVSVTQSAETVAALAKRLMERKAAEEAVGKAVAGALQAELAMVSASAARAKALGDEAGALSAQAAAATLGLAAKQADLALTEQAIARAQEEIAARAASGVAKRSELEALAQTITALEGEALARRGAIAATQAEILQAQVAAATYGDQSDQLTGLIQTRDRLSAAIRREGEASAALIPLQQALSVIQVQIADAATDAAAGIERQTQANQRALTIDQARLALQSDETARLAALATARGNATQAAQYHRDIMRDEAAALELASKAKERDAAMLLERARLMEIAAKATGGYTAEERAAVDAMRDSATMAEIEAERMAIGAETKRDAAREAAELAERNRRLAESFEAAGTKGVRAMDDVRAAVARAASGPELAALRDGLEAAIQAGVDSAGDLADALQEVLDKMDGLESKETRKFTTSYEEMFRKYGTDLNKVQQANTGLSGEQANNLIESYSDWLREQGFFGGPRPKARSEMTAREVAQTTGGRGTGGGFSTQTIVVQIDGREVATAIDPHLTQLAARRA